jgi:ABC-type antimicrobial peptide transport system permease subunit
MDHHTNIKNRCEAIVMSTTSIALASLFVGLLLHIGLVAISFTGHPLAWSWLVQIAGVVCGVTVGMVLGVFFVHRK